MRKVILMLAMILPMNVFSQEFEFEKVINVDKSKEMLYSASKSFVADFWNSAKTVTQNEDEISCTLQLKALKTMEVKVGMGMYCSYDYVYRVKIQAKEKRCRIQIYDVYCKDAWQDGLGGKQDIPEIQPFNGDNTEQKTKKMGRGISKEKAVEMINGLKSYFENIISQYETSVSEDDDW